MIDFPFDRELMMMKDRLDLREREILSPLAALSSDALRRNPENRPDHRQSFALDCDRILHSRAYTRYIDKTQVFSLIANDHITHRVLHVQLVSKIARSVGRFMGLNEDLIEAIALGHDIGHPPFGHDGERILSILCREHDLPPFRHNIQSVQALERLERGGRGWNLTLQTLDGIICHDGESHAEQLTPGPARDFAGLDQILDQSMDDPARLLPMTLEGCLVRLCDTIAYIGRDIEDAIELALVRREDLPKEISEVLGNTNGTMVYRLVADLIKNGCEQRRLFFSPALGEALKLTKKFNYERIYLNPVIKRGLDEIAHGYRVLFEGYLDDIITGRHGSPIFAEFLDRMTESYLDSTPPAARVRDYLAGMTDEYFLSRVVGAGCSVPGRVVLP